MNAGFSRTARANLASRRALITVKTRMNVALMPKGSRTHFGNTPKIKTSIASLPLVKGPVERKRIKLTPQKQDATPK